MLKVLLVSPLDPEKPGNLKFLMGGENTYTRTLLSHPPKGVKYFHHQEALAKGLISYLPIQNFLVNLVRFRILPLSSGTQAILLKDKFDLVHVHGYSLKIEGGKIPIVISDSSSNYLFLRDYLNWPEWRIKAGFFLRKKLFERLNVVDSDTNWQGTKKIVVFSKFAAIVHQNLGEPVDKIEVIYPGLSSQKIQTKKDKKTVNILFVGIWFERKGGLPLLEAFKIIVKKFPNLRLTIVGSVPDHLKVKYQKIWSKIEQQDFVPRKNLLTQFFPKADILVLVPPVAEGYGFVVSEAASFGVPAVVTGVYALPELVDDGKTGFVVEPGNVAELVEKLAILIEDYKLRQKFGQAALEKFKRQFSIEVSNQKLLDVYNEALIV